MPLAVFWFIEFGLVFLGDQIRLIFAMSTRLFVLCPVCRLQFDASRYPHDNLTIFSLLSKLKLAWILTIHVHTTFTFPFTPYYSLLSLTPWLKTSGAREHAAEDLVHLELSPRLCRWWKRLEGATLEELLELGGKIELVRRRQEVEVCGSMWKWDVGIFPCGFLVQTKKVMNTCQNSHCGTSPTYHCLCLSLFVVFILPQLPHKRNSSSTSAGSPWFGAGCWITAMLPWGSIYYAWRMNDLTRRLIFKNPSTRPVRRYDKSKHIVFVWFILHQQRTFQLCSKLKIDMYVLLCVMCCFFHSRFAQLFCLLILWSGARASLLLRKCCEVWPVASPYRPGMLSVLSWVSSPSNFA